MKPTGPYDSLNELIKKLRSQAGVYLSVLLASAIILVALDNKFPSFNTIVASIIVCFVLILGLFLFLVLLVRDHYEDVIVQYEKSFRILSNYVTKSQKSFITSNSATGVKPSEKIDGYSPITSNSNTTVG